MPKMKTNRGAKKRFKRRGNGTIKCRRASHRHILTKQKQKVKRNARKMQEVSKCDAPAIARML